MSETAGNEDKLRAENSFLKNRIREVEQSEAECRKKLESIRGNITDILFRYDTLTEKSRSIILEWDSDGNILFLNRWGLELFGFTEEELIGRNVLGTIVPPTDDRGENLTEKMSRVVRNPDDYYSSENVNIRKNGEKLWISWTNIGVRDPDGNIIKTLSIGIDRTVQRWQELALMNHSIELEAKVLERTRELREIVATRTLELEETRRASEALQTSEERFRLSMEATNDGVWDWDIRTDSGYYSPAYYRMLGYEVHGFAATGRAWADLIHPEDRENALQTSKDCIEGLCEQYESTFRMRAKNGEWRWILDRGTCVTRDKHGRALRLIGTHMDITERKLAEETLRSSEQKALRSARQLRMLNEIGSIIVNGLDMEKVLQTAYEQCWKIGDASTFHISLYDDKSGMLSFPIAYRAGERVFFPPYDIRNKPGIAKIIIASRRGICLPDLANLPEGIHIGRMTPVLLAKSYLGVPLIVEDQVVGILTMQSYTPNSYSEEQLHELELLGTQVAIALKNSQLYEQVQQEKHLVDTIVDNLPGIFAMTDQSGRIIRWNDNLETLTGFSSKELYCLGVTNLIDEEDRSRVIGIISQIVQSRRGDIETRLLTKRGDKGIPVYVTATRIQLGNETGRIYLGIDISERKRSEEALKESEARFRNLYDVSPDGIIQIGLDGRIENANLEQARMYGYSGPEEMVGLPATHCVAPSSRPYSEQIMHRRLNGEEFPHVEYELIKKDGTLFYGEVNAAILRNPQGTVSGYICITRDTTKNKLAEQALRESEERYKAMFEGSQSVQLLLDPDTGIIHDANPAACDFYGWSREHLTNMNIAEINILPKKALDAEIQEAMEQRRNYFHFKHRLGDGSIRDVEVRSAPICIKEKRLLFSIIHDITEQRRAEEQAREYMQFQNTLLEKMPAGMFIVDAETRSIEYVNDTALSLFGCAAETNIIGKRCNKVFCPVNDEACPILDLNQEVDNSEKILVRADGSQRSILKSVMRVQMHGREKLLECFIDLTERKKAEKLLQDNELKYRTLFETANDAILLMLDDRFISCNARALSIFGCDQDRLIGASPGDFSPTLQPDGRLSLEKSIEKIRLAMTSGPQSFEWVHCRADGTHFSAEVSLNVLELEGKTYIQSLVRDVTERKQNEQNHIARLKAEAERERFESFYNTSSASHVIINRQGKITSCNTTFLHLLNYPSIHDVMDRSILELAPEKQPNGRDSRAMGMEMVNSAIEQRGIKFDWWCRSSVGEDIPVEASIVPLILDGEFQLMGIWTDLRTRMEMEMQLKSAKQVADEANRAKSMFLSNMSHEIRTPMNAILGFAQILERDPSLSVKQAGQVRSIIRSGSHLLTLINDILDMSKIEAGMAKITPSVFCLHDLLDDIHMIFRSRAEGSGLQMLLERDATVPYHVLGDEGKLRQVLVNLVGNAVKFTKQGKVVVRVRTEPAQDRLRENPPVVRVLFEVMDTGPGIHSKDMNNIFKAFVQTEAGYKAGGTGLGLPISKKLVELMGGILSMESEVGTGSCFHFDVLLSVAEGAKKVEKPEPRQVIGLAPGSGPWRILVVDDIKENRNLLCDLLQPLGFEIREAENGVVALEVFTAWSPHAVLMDMRMPVMDGYEATRRIKATEKGSLTPIIAVTASVFKDSEGDILQTGASGYVRKPFRPEDIHEVLGKCLGLSYVYADSMAQPHSQTMTAIGPATLSGLPDSLIEAMRDAVSGGDMNRLEELIVEVQALDNVTAQGLAALAERYDYSTLLELTNTTKAGAGNE